MKDTLILKDSSVIELESGASLSALTVFSDTKENFVKTWDKLTEDNLSEVTFKNVLFEECSGKYTLFRFAELKETIFENCQIPSADFYQSGLVKVEFRTTDINQSQFVNTKLKGIDFTSCNIDGISAGIEDIQGAVVSYSQAISLIGLLGVVLKE